jgi:hypothetical protein
MRGVRVELFALTLLVFFGASPAECQPAPAFTAAFNSWARCLADTIRPRVQSSDSAATIANLALAQCKSSQAQAIAVGEKYHGAAGKQAVLDYVPTFRAQLPQMLSNARTGRPSDHPNERWAQCATATALDYATKSDDPAELIADRSFASCRTFEEQAFADYAKGSDKQLAKQNFALVRGTMRSQIIDAVKAARSQKR